VQELLDVLRLGHRNEPRPRIQIVFAGFIDHAQVIALLRRSVLQNLIDLAKLQRSGLLAVMNADDEVV
jgi:hypothetical protein